MSTPKVKRLYTVYYTDGSYLSYLLTKEEYECIGKGLGTPCSIKTDVGYLLTRDMRSIVIVREQPKPQENPSANPDMSKEEVDWYESQKLAERILKESDPNENPDDDVDYAGGDLIVS